MAQLAKPTVSTFLWFDTQAEEAARFYVSLFEGSRLVQVMPGPEGRALVVDFELGGHRIQAMNGGPVQTLSPAVSLVVHCGSQQEVDAYWERLLDDGGKEMACGWLTDRFGLCWQVVPTRFFELIADPDKQKVGRVMQAMMQMVKFDVARLEEAARG